MTVIYMYTQPHLLICVLGLKPSVFASKLKLLVLLFIGDY